MAFQELGGIGLAGVPSSLLVVQPGEARPSTAISGDLTCSYFWENPFPELINFPWKIPVWDFQLTWLPSIFTRVLFSSYSITIFLAISKVHIIWKLRSLLKISHNHSNKEISRFSSNLESAYNKLQTLLSFPSYSMHSWLSTLSDHILSYFEPGYENASKIFRTLNWTFSIKYNNELVVNSNTMGIECKWKRCKPNVNETLVSCFKVEKYWCELIHQERVVYEWLHGVGACLLHQ